MQLQQFLMLASDATLIGLFAAAFLLVAVAAVVAERRRTRRTNIDAVGCMPWTTIFFLAFFCSVVLAGVAAKSLMGR